MLQGRRRYLFGLRASAAVAVFLLAGLPAGADTLEQALVQAYQNNPQLNAQRAATRAVDENVSIALGGYRPRVTATGSLSEVYLENVARAGSSVWSRTAARMRSRPSASPPRRRCSTASRPATARGRPSRRCLRRAKRCAPPSRRCLLSAVTAYMNLSARHRDARAAAQQRDRARSDAAADARSLQCRRGDAHRRGAGGIAAGRRPLAVADRGIELHHLEGATIGR